MGLVENWGGKTMGLPHVKWLGESAGLGKPKSIFIADDSEAVRTAVRAALQLKTKFVICGEAGDGSEAVTKAKELSPDLIILDVRMPGLNGFEVAGILRYTFPKIHIVLMSLFDDHLTHSLPSVIRIDGMLSKSDGLTKLIESVENLLND